METTLSGKNYLQMMQYARGIITCRRLPRPKMHAPSKGLTIRSLVTPSGSVLWRRDLSLLGNIDRLCSQRESMNLLVVPWPERIKPVQFKRVPRSDSGMRNMPE